MRQWRSGVGAGTVMLMVVEPQSLESLSAEQLRSALLSMLQAAAAKDQELAFEQPPSTSSPTRTRCSSA